MKFKIAFFMLLFFGYSALVYAKADANDIISDPRVQNDFNLLGSMDGANRLAQDSRGQISLQEAQAMQRLKVADACANQPSPQIKQISSSTMHVYLGLCKLMGTAPRVDVILPAQQQQPSVQ